MKRFNKAIWFFGFSGAGKTTLSEALSSHYIETGTPHILLDGDIIRNGLNNDLGFTREDRKENIRRLAEICKLLLGAGIVPIVAAITPYLEDRILVLEILTSENLFMIFVNCPLSICEERDPKGLYKQARQGKLKNFTGVSDIFDPPNNAFRVETGEFTIMECLAQVLKKIRNS